MRNFTKMSTAAILLLAIVFIACKEDEALAGPTIPDPTGTYVLASAELVDPNPLVLLNYPGPTGDPIPQLPIPAGALSIPMLTPVVAGLLGSVACENPVDYASYTLEFAADGTLIFNCVAAGTSDSSGSWSITLDDDGNYTKLNLFITVNGNNYPLLLESLVITATNLSGTATNLPIQEDFANPIPPTGTGTLIPIEANLVLTKQ